LKLGNDFYYEKYNCKTGLITRSEKINCKKINIIEGVYSMHPVLRDAYHLKIFLTIDQATQRQRILTRNGMKMLERFEKEWIPLENAYFNQMDRRTECDLVIDTSSFLKET
jgi:uridine kinase